MELVLPQDFQQQDAPQVLDEARPMLDLPPNTELRVDSVTRTTRGTRIAFSYTQAVQLDDDNLQGAAGVCVEVSAHGELKFNARGTLVTYNVEPADPRQLQAITANVSKLVENGEVYVAKPGEKVDPDKLRQQGKSWYVQEDEDGNKRLKRAWIS